MVLVMLDVFVGHCRSNEMFPRDNLYWIEEVPGVQPSSISGAKLVCDYYDNQHNQKVCYIVCAGIYCLWQTTSLLEPTSFIIIPLFR